jgi:hypothetical protein
MKTTLFIGLALTTAGLSCAAEFTGFLADSKCAAAGKANSAEHAACAKKCVQGGADIVLVTPDKVYKLKSPDKVKNHVGEKVTLDGTLDGDTIDVQRGKPAQ